jgi:adenylylsulfate kinase
MMPNGAFLEIYLSCPLSVCESRDAKGLYQRARAGDIPVFTGISSPFEPPEHPELVLDTANLTIDECLDQLVLLVKAHEILSPNPVPDKAIQRNR